MIVPNAQAMLDFARPGDTIVVWRLDRLGRSLTHLIETVMGLQARGINFRSLTERVDTSTPGGKCTFHLFGALAEMERDVIRQRTQAGLEAARARGRIGGRPALHPDARKLQRARELYEKQEMSVAESMALTGFASRYSFYEFRSAISSPVKEKQARIDILACFLLQRDGYLLSLMLHAL